MQNKIPGRGNEKLIQSVKVLFSELSGIETGELSEQATFLELGFDSLFLTRAHALIQNKFDVKISFRQLFEELSTVGLLAAHIASVHPSGDLAGQTQPEQGPASIVPETVDHRETIVHELSKILHELSGIDLAEIVPEKTFLEMGFDSLFLTRATTAFEKRFNVKVSFRQLFDTTPTLETLADDIAKRSPCAPVEPQPSSQPVADPPQVTRPLVERPQEGGVVEQVSVPGLSAPGDAVERIIAEQLQIMERQIALLEGGSVSPSVAPGKATTPADQNIKKQAVPPVRGMPDLAPVQSQTGANQRVSTQKEPSHGPWKPIAKAKSHGLSAGQQSHLEALITRFVDRTRKSKEYAQSNRAHLADPRTVAGFRKTWKEMVYPIVADRTAGSRLWDLDGNEWIDITMGFGVTLFGHSPAFVTEAIERQLQRSMAIGPQTPLAGQAARLICELTGSERAAFCNTGSEAVLAAMRMARTVLGKEKIAFFSGDYHGIFDEVLAKNITVSGKRRSIPVAPGIPTRSVEQVLILDYGDMASLDTIRQHADDLAAVIVEPIQGRNPQPPPRAFLVALRELTESLGIALVFDEIITGFRLHPGGAQAYLGVQADIATYGKVLAGGMPIGVVAGKSKYLDALDGGMWQFGDDSVPEVGVTWFAGTFVRHPLTMAAAHAALVHMKEHGASLQQQVNDRTERFVQEMNHYYQEHQFPIKIRHFASLFLIEIGGEREFSGLYYHFLRDKFIHCHEGRPNFFTTAHTDEDIAHIQTCFKEAAQDMRAGGFFGGGSPQPVASEPQSTALDLSVPAQTALTEEQREVWLASQWSQDASRSFNLCYRLDLRGALNMEALQKSVDTLLARRDGLRMYIDSSGEHLCFSTASTVELAVEDWSVRSAEQKQHDLKRLIDGEYETPFELDQGPLFRMRLVRCADEHHVLLLTFHHLVVDGTSAGIIVRELATVYSAFCTTGCAPDLDTPMSYHQYALWQQQSKQKPEYAEAEKYWVGQCSDPVPPVLDLPTDHPRPSQKLFASKMVRTTLSSELCGEIKRIARENRWTLYTTLLGAFVLWLHKLTGQDDVVVGLVSSGQSLVGQEVVGHCAIQQPLRSRTRWDWSVREHIGQIQKLILDAFEHRNYTEGALLRKLNLPRDPSRLPLINAQFNLDAAPLRAVFDGLDVDVAYQPRHYNVSDLTLNALDLDGQLVLTCDYNTSLFDPGTIESWLQHYEIVLRAIVKNVGLAVGKISLLSTDEQRRLTKDWNATDRQIGDWTSVHQRFDEQAGRCPDAVAVVFNDQTLTYAQLNSRANQLAHHLISLGVKPGVLVGVMMDRSVDLMVVLLGILKAGGAYAPLDPSYPAQRLKFMLEDTGATVLVTGSALAGTIDHGGITVLDVDRDRDQIAQGPTHDPGVTVAGDDLAYVMYTSGSTGRPKGVSVPHRAILRLLLGVDYVELGSEHTFLQMAPVSFDASTFEIWGALLHGGCCVLCPDRVPTSQTLGSLIREHQVTTLWLTSSLFNAVIDQDPHILSPVRQLLIGGEALSVPHVRRAYEHLQHTQIINGYGPTEGTTFTCCYRIPRRLEDGLGSIPIGRPIANTQVYILDAGMQPVPVGVPGQLYIGGDGLAHGYLNRSQLTAEKFVVNPFDGDARLYRTGDRCRYLPDGHIEFLGRLDDQVKIRGHRIEPKETETVLAKHPSVRQAVVTVDQDPQGGRQLVGYVVPVAEPAPAPTVWQEHLRQTLPEYMIPSVFIALKALPLTPNGKVDLRALPKPGGVSQANAQHPFVPARNQLERSLTAIWRNVLGIDRIGIKDNFFDLGGHSLKALSMFGQIEKQFGRTLSLSNLFTAPTIERLAKVLDQTDANQTINALVPLQPEGSRPPLFIVPGVGGHPFSFRSLAQILQTERPVYGLQLPGLDGKQQPLTGVQDMARHFIHHICQLRQSGPYHLAGYSFGGVVAYEIARQLALQGKQIGLLALFDAYVPGAFRKRPLTQRLVAHGHRLWQLDAATRWGYLRDRWSNVKKRFQAHASKDTDSRCTLTESIRRVKMASKSAFDQYRPEPFDGRGILFKAQASEYVDFCTADETNGWKRLFGGGLEIQQVPVGHRDLFSEAGVQVLAEAIRRQLVKQANSPAAGDPMMGPIGNCAALSS